MDKWIDLHTHSTFSDGSMTPAELVDAARAAGLAAIALTDHDTTDGIGDFLAAGERTDVETMAGVEISLEFQKRTVHMLGYGIDHTHKRLREALEQLVDARNERNEQMVRKLQLLGVRIELEEIRAVAGEQVIGRPHVAQVLIQKGAVRDFNEAFDRFLARGKPAYCERVRLEPDEAITLIGEAGGLAVLAHPYLIGLSPDALEVAIGRMKELGLAGIEVYYSEHDEEATRQYLELAQRLDLLVTGGTDFHGGIKPEIQLGRGRGSLHVPYTLFERLREALNDRPQK